MHSAFACAPKSHDRDRGKVESDWVAEHTVAAAHPVDDLDHARLDAAHLSALQGVCLGKGLDMLDFEPHLIGHLEILVMQ